jgi:hypothetical protein
MAQWSLKAAFPEFASDHPHPTLAIRRYALLLPTGAPKLRARITAAEAALNGWFAIAKNVASICEQRPHLDEVTLVSIELRTARQMLSDLLHCNSDQANDITPERLNFFAMKCWTCSLAKTELSLKIYFSTIGANVVLGNNHLDIQGYIRTWA